MKIREERNESKHRFNCNNIHNVSVVRAAVGIIYAAACRLQT